MAIYASVDTCSTLLHVSRYLGDEWGSPRLSRGTREPRLPPSPLTVDCNVIDCFLEEGLLLLPHFTRTCCSFDAMMEIIEVVLNSEKLIVIPAHVRNQM